MTNGGQDRDDRPIAGVQTFPLATFDLTESAIADLSAMYLSLTIDGVDDTEGFKAVHGARMTMVTHRTDVDKRRLDLSRDARIFISETNARAKQLTGLLAPIEAHLNEQEDAYKTEKERLRRAKADAEAAEAKRIADAEAARVKAEQDARAALIKAEQDKENERIRITRLKLETDRREFEKSQAIEEAKWREAEAERKRLAAIEQKKLDDQRRELAKKQAAEEAERKRLAAIEQKKLDDQRRELEVEQELHRQEMEAKTKELQAEQKRLLDLEAERKRQEGLKKAKAEAAERAKQESEERIVREAAEARARVDAEQAARIRAEELRPDREKLAAVADAVMATPIPEVSGAASNAAHRIKEMISEVARRIRVVASSSWEVE